nr:MAG TPA: hypothetical protein [Caudoviricetes sp.]
MKTGCLIRSLTGGKERLKRYVSSDLQRRTAYGFHALCYHQYSQWMRLHWPNGYDYRLCWWCKSHYYRWRFLKNCDNHSFHYLTHLMLRCDYGYPHIQWIPIRMHCDCEKQVPRWNYAVRYQRFTT